MARAIFSLMWLLSIAFACFLIKLFTFTWGKHGKVTRYKIWRIRKFTEFKIWLYENHRTFCMMIDREVEFAYIRRKFKR